MTNEPPSEETSPFNSLDWKSRVENPKPLMGWRSRIERVRLELEDGAIR